jgi:ribosomal protein L2
MKIAYVKRAAAIVGAVAALATLSACVIAPVAHPHGGGYHRPVVVAPAPVVVRPPVVVVRPGYYHGHGHYRN